MYNGKKNYFTWALFNSVTNYENTYNHYRGIYAAAIDGGQDEAHAVATLAEALKNDLDAAGIIPGQDEKALLYRDLLTAAIQEIDFEEVAQGIAEE